MPRLFDFRAGKAALLYLECDIRMFQPCLYIVNVLNIVSDRVFVDHYVIDINERRLQLILVGYDIKGLLEERVGFLWAQRHASVLIGSGLRDDRYFRPAFLPDVHPPLSQIRIQRCKQLTESVRVDGIAMQRKGLLPFRSISSGLLYSTQKCD